MALTANKIILPDGAPVAGKQLTKSSVMGSANLMNIGWWNYDDSVTAGTPINIPGTLTDVQLTNSGLGPQTTEAFKPFGATVPIWNSTTNEFDFSGLPVGAMVDLRLNYSVTTSGPTQLVIVEMDFAIGSVSNFQLLINETSHRSAGVHNATRFTGFYIGSTDLQNFPTHIHCRSDATATVVVQGWYIKATYPHVEV